MSVAGFIVTFLFCLCCFAKSDKNAIVGYDPPPDNTFMKFVQFWVPEACYNDGVANCLNFTQNVTIHGIWPSSYNGSDPSYCTNQTLTESDISSIEDQLNQNWKSYSSTSNFDFWTHEWEKHGTCWTSLTVLEFFQQALDWHAAYNIPQILSENGIDLNVLYDTSSVDEILTDNLDGTLSIVECSSGTYVVYVMQCYDWYMKPIDCPPPESSACGSQVSFYGGPYPTSSYASPPQIID